MSIRNLDILLKPASVALIGASKKARTVGSVLAHNLFGGGFDGPIMPVNPTERAIEGVLAYPTVADLPRVPDLAVIATPPPTIPAILAELGARGTRSAIVISAGFAELGAEGETLQQAMLDAAKPYTLRVLGPNCLGLMIPGRGLNATFAQRQALPGDLAFLSQSGAVLTGVLDWASARGIGFSHMVSLGDMADVDFGDLLDYFAADPHTRAILLYVEAITHARKFMSAARSAARSKPVVVIKSGRSQEAAEAARSHTGALAGADDVYDAAFCRAGMLRVDNLDELFAAVETLGSGIRVKGDRLAIVSNGGGIGVLATDSLIGRGGKLAAFAEPTLAALNAALPPTWSHGNPVDLIGDAPGARYEAALEAVLADRGVDAALVLNCPTAIADSTEAAEATIACARRHRAPVLTCWLGEASAAKARQRFAEEKIPTYETPNEAASAFAHLIQYHRSQEMLKQVPPSIPEDFKPDVKSAERVVAGALVEGREWLTEPEAKAVLEAYGIATVPTLIASGPDEAARLAADLECPVVLKILSPDIVHKSDVGGVMLGLTDPWTVYEAARTMLTSVRTARPDANIEGLTVQPMVERGESQEIIIGVSDDVLFGPVILFGQGGTAVEIFDDRALALPPLNLALAHEMMRSTRVFELLQGFRGRPAAAIDEVALALVKVAQMVADLDHVAELDINPLVVDQNRVLALDARIRLREPVARGTRRLAIRPYPKKLEQVLTLKDGKELFLRPIRPEDAAALRVMVERHTTPEDRRLRFFTSLKTLTPELSAQLTQIDYDREMALVAIDLEQPGEESFWGVVRLAADPDLQRAEYAVLVRSDRKGHGLGTKLMQTIIAYARDQGIGEVFGTVLRENRGMLGVVERLGFRFEGEPDEPEVVSVRLPLTLSDDNSSREAAA